MELEKVNTMNEKNTNKRNNTMRRYIFLFSVMILFVIGCSEESNILSPANDVNTNEPNWISLPSVNSANGMSVMSMPVFQMSDSIDGEKGGKIKIDEKYDGPNGEVKVKAELVFPKGAFSGTKYITMILDTDFGNATFTPHAVFENDAIYNAEFQGLDLTAIDKMEAKNVEFVYQAADGSYEYIETSKIEVDVKNGKLKVRDAKLPHFSRYGFVN